jgi:ABC-2 type transport system permease protein
MTALFQEVYILTWRAFQHLRREPIRIVFTVIQPVLWLVFFGNLFRNTGQPPGFPAADYLSFLTAGVIVMTIVGNSLAGGIPLLFDKETGFLFKLLVAPISRSAILISAFLSTLSVSLLQVLLILLVASLMGVQVVTGGWGILMLLGIAILLGIGITALSLALAFVLKSHGEFFAFIGFATLPLIFLSSALAPLEVMPSWMRFLAYLNPMTYTINGIRVLIIQGWEWFLLLKIGFVLLGFDCLLVSMGIRVFHQNLE